MEYDTDGSLGRAMLLWAAEKPGKDALQQITELERRIAAIEECIRRMSINIAVLSGRQP